MPKVDLTKKECEYLAMAMNEAIIQTEGELFNLSESDGTEEEVMQTMAIRSVFNSIKIKMERAAQ